MPQQNTRNKMNSTPASTGSSNKPSHVVRYGGIKAVIWQNQTSNGPMYNVTVARTYKDGEEWKESSSFGADELLTLAKALNEAHTWIFEQRARNREQEQAA
jgi:hypothetical protein